MRKHHPAHCDYHPSLFNRVLHDPLTASVGGSVISGGLGLLGANKAAKAQTRAADAATQAQLEMFYKTQENLQPYMNLGKSGSNALMKYMGLDEGGDPLNSPLLKPITMDQAALEQTPGYQFNKTQGLKSVQNAAAARGLGVSGAALKGAATYATGLADSTYQNQFSNAVTNQTNQFNRLMSATTLGENAASGYGVQATQTGSNIGNNIIGAGNAQGAANIAGYNSLARGVQGAGNAYFGGMYGDDGGYSYVNEPWL